MLKTLFKKQMMEMFRNYFVNAKTGKARSKVTIGLYMLMFAGICVILGSMFAMAAVSLAPPLLAANAGWMYFSIMGLISIALGVFGSAFNTFSGLYLSKDNDLLFSMPIPVKMILASRLAGVYAMGFLYELMVMLPALIVYFWVAGFNLSVFICAVVTTVFISVFIMVLSCVLGYVVAIVSSKVKNKSLITVVLSLGFIAAYYYVYGNAYKLLQVILADVQGTEKTIKRALYPLYHLGMGAEGNLSSLLLFGGMVLVLFAVLYWVLERNFIRIATTNKGSKKVAYVEKEHKVKSVKGALLYKELKRFLSSPTYMLNCGLGTVALVLISVFVLVKRDTILLLMAEVFEGQDNLVLLLICGIVGMTATMNDITAPSVSLEGKSLWLIQSLPVSSWQVLLAKLKLHLLLTDIPAILCVLCIDIVLKPGVFGGIMIPVVVMLFILFMGLFGLMMNLLKPDVNWTNETAPVKQSMGVLITLFGGWAVIVVLGGAYYLVYHIMTAEIFLLCTAAVLAGFSWLMLWWLRHKGTKILERL